MDERDSPSMQLDELAVTADSEASPAREWSAVMRRPWAVGLGASILTFVGLVVLNRDLASAQIAVAGDPAANQLLIDRALEGKLLTGHYSRLGFFHPGPFFLYVQALGEWFLYDFTGWVRSPFASHVFAVAGFNSVVLGWATALATKFARSALIGIMLPVFAQLLAVAVPQLYVQTAIPATVVAPFMLMCVSLIVVLNGGARHLPSLVASAGMVANGHLALAAFAAGVLAAAAGLLVVRARREGESQVPRSTLLWSAAAGAAFAVLPAAHVLLNWPGELDEYFRFLRGGGAGRVGLGESVSLFFRVVMHGGLVAFALVLSSLAAVAATRRSAEWNQRITSALIVCWVLLGAAFLYAWRGVDDPVNEYLLWFATSITAVLGWLAAAALVAEANARWGPRGSRGVAAVAGIALVAVLLPGDQLRERFRGSPHVGEIAGLIAKEPTRLAFDEASWPVAVGALSTASKAGAQVCVDDAEWAFLVTAHHICAASQADGWRHLFVASNASAVPDQGTVLYDGGDQLLIAVG